MIYIYMYVVGDTLWGNMFPPDNDLGLLSLTLISRHIFVSFFGSFLHNSIWTDDDIGCFLLLLLVGCD